MLIQQKDEDDYIISNFQGLLLKKIKIPLVEANNTKVDSSNLSQFTGYPYSHVDADNS